MMDKVAIYLHWPFCVAKCPYCDFVSYPSTKENFQEYEDLLLEDLRKTISVLDINSVSSIFFGGGTPSLMSVRSVGNIVEFLGNKLTGDAEISLEANPATFDKTKLQSLKKVGVNRLSLGVQSFQEENLRFLGRIYSENQAKKAADLVAENFENFSLDFMYGYQSITSVKSDLQIAMDYNARHLSCYQLTLEPGTPFYAQFSGLKNFDKENYMEFMEKFLSARGIYRYEISNFAYPKYKSQHNLTYWNYGNYLGCGPSAHSRLIINGQKHATTKHSNLKLWREKIGQWDIDSVLSYEDQLEEVIITGLRKIQGIRYDEIFRLIPEDVVKKIITVDKLNFLKRCNLIFQKNDRIQLTSEGLMRLNSVIESLLY